MFQAGQSGNPRGRPKGTPNKTKTAVADVCRRLVEDQQYRRAFKKRLHGGTLPPQLEAMAWHYAYGKPIETHEHTGPEGGPIVYAWQESA